MASMLKLALAASAIVWPRIPHSQQTLQEDKTWAPGVQKQHTRVLRQLWLSLMAPELTRDGQVCAGPWVLDAANSR